MTGIGRRSALGLVGLAAARPAPAGGPAFLSAAADAGGGWRAVAFGLDGAMRFDLPLPARGHGAALAPGGEAVALFARRPGEFALVLDPVTGRRRARIDRATGRWFCGHGAFSIDGALLYATEIDGAGEGVVGVYAARRGFARIGEFATGGADPHDIRLTPDGRRLWVANGGIRADPRLPRVRLDLESFESSLVQLDATSGALIARYRLAEEEETLLSLRHLAIGADGEVFVAMQHEGPRHERPPLVAATKGGALAALEAAPELWRTLDNYIGSAAAAPDGELVAVTSPRGGAGLLIEARTRRVRARFAMADGCGVAAAPGGFVVTSGLGGAALIHAHGARTELAGERLGRMRWDNHLVPL
ncbi:DUF1513 domain-containing protein [Roseomonas eburnea]|uniref:DUF1513 domain-containing protein n=1 Tax=Neoroseomonas eburnea TaxID=1346889 RepID=A0A9X9XDR0_9PROT|nr:DUF1513 domain-containing protein [Neoroseomonas eburnea]MBR0681846.1 DUF1513 domain-containing protein [Neoroseomonas eburnea]